MALRQINQKEIEKYNYYRNPILVGMNTETQWYSDDDLKIISIITKDNIDKDWGYVIMALDEDRQYRYTDGEISISSEEEATNTMKNKMSQFSKTGKIESLIYSSNLFDNNSSVIVKDIDDEIKKFFKKYPQKLYDLNPRKFEELIASILKDLGFDIELTKATRDGGRDIIAIIKKGITNYVTYIECKRYDITNKVGVGIIREVIGVHTLRKPEKSIIVTTSFFTKNAIQEAKLFDNKLELKDYNDLKSLLQKY